jgi:hypothetical protein
MGASVGLNLIALERRFNRKPALPKASALDPQQRMIHVECQNCGKELDLAEAVGGTMRKCPACDAQFAVPKPEPPILEKVVGGEEEFSDFEVMEEQGEEDRIGARPRRRRRRPERRRVEKV